MVCGGAAGEIGGVCVELGVPVSGEDRGGGESGTAAIAQLAHCTPAEGQFQSSAFHEYSTVSIAVGAPSVKDGYRSVADTAGLGVTPILESLTNVFECS